MPGKGQTTPLSIRFWSKVNVGSDDQCWNWTAGTNTSGYGQIWDGSRLRLATRIIYEWTHGSIPDGLNVLHSCDNPLCVNPSHLWAGTQLENVQDCVNKKRVNAPSGEHHNKAKLTEQYVREIRTLHATGNYTCGDLAVLYHVSSSTIARVVSYQLWKMVD